MNILIVGCGDVGRALALKLSDKGHDVSVLDRNQTALDSLDDNYEGLTFCGVAIDADKLSAAGIAACDVVCAVTNDDNTNIMVSQLARELYHVPVVLTRVFDSTKGSIYQTFGLRTICSTALTVEAIYAAIDDYDNERYMHYGTHKLKFYTVELPKEYVGAKAVDIDCDEGEVLYAIIHADESMKLVNNYNIILNEGDKLIFSTIVE